MNDLFKSFFDGCRLLDFNRSCTKSYLIKGHFKSLFDDCRMIDFNPMVKGQVLHDEGSIYILL